MRCLGIEGTAHTAGVGIVEIQDELGLDTSAERISPEHFRILANEMKLYSPPQGGIHPREAANHHANELPALITAAIERAGVAFGDLDIIAFSQGPGLGPCLRTAATAARVLALSLGVPLIGVNHCVAHLEVGGLVGAVDPILLYASGGNTQVIAFANGRYRVFGETLDIGVGNMLDKFGLRLGLRFPPGPTIEKIALESDTFIPLPYSVKGMDMAFSGILTAALSAHKRGAKVEDLCYSLQETVFAMMTEVTERAMAHTEKDEVLLGGGVVQNKRFQAMVRAMAEARGAGFFVPPNDLCRDNGAMIALTGLIMARHGIEHSLADSVVNQKYRTDEVTVTWRTEPPSLTRDQRLPRSSQPSSLLRHGAEAEIHKVTWHGRPAVAKRRCVKGYRLPAIDEQLRQQRSKHECRLIAEARANGVRTPIIYDLDPFTAEILMEFVPGPRVKDILSDRTEGIPPKDVQEEAFKRQLCRRIGSLIGKLHRADIVHGDLTTSNILSDGEMETGTLFFIDFSLGERTESVEAKGVDLHVFLEAFESTHSELMPLLDETLAGYREAYPSASEVTTRVQEIAQRGRYVSA